jgi:DNA-binding NarL/FixJ family response regulator
VRILVVENAAPVRARLAEMLGEIAGVIAVLEAGSFDEASALLQVVVPEVVVLDLHLGRQSGMDLLPIARARRADALLVVVTNDPTEHHRRACLSRGADHFFDKASEFHLVLELVSARSRGR